MTVTIVIRIIVTVCMLCRVQLMTAGLSQPGSTWYMLKLSSMSTIMREWSALHAVQDLKFQDVLLTANRSTTQRRTSKLLVPQVLRTQGSHTVSPAWRFAEATMRTAMQTYSRMCC